MLTGRTTSQLLIALLLSASVACGGGGQAASCDQVADDTATAVQDALTELGDTSLADAETKLTEMGSDFESRFEDLENQVQEVCESEEEFGGLIATRLDGLEAEGPAGELFLEGMKSEFGEF